MFSSCWYEDTFVVTSMFHKTYCVAAFCLCVYNVYLTLPMFPAAFVEWYIHIYRRQKAAASCEQSTGAELSFMNTLRFEQIGQQFANDIAKYVLLTEKCILLTKKWWCLFLMIWLAISQPRFRQLIPHPVASQHRWLVKAPRWIHSVPDVSDRRSWRCGCYARLWNLHDVANTSHL